MPKTPASSRFLQPQPRFFPPNPNVGDQVTGPDGTVWEWNGTSWVRVEGGGGGPLTDPTTTLGDLIVRGSAAITRLGVGANNDVLTADSTAPLRVAWKTGAGAASYTHTASVASATWIVPHNLGSRYVAVQLISDTGDTMLADVDFVSTIRCDIEFSRAVTGTAVIRR